MKKGIFRRIFLLLAAVMSAAVIFTEVFITDAVRESHITDLTQNLSLRISLISGTIPFPQPRIDSLCRQVRDRVQARVTVIGRDGKVLGDSDSDSSLMDNHADRVEIEKAVLTGTGSSIRHSATLKTDFLYVARRITTGGDTIGFVRLSVPLDEVYRAVNMLRAKIFLVTGMVFIASAALFFWQIERLRRLLLQIRRFSRSLAGGELGRRLFLREAPEFHEIAEDLTAMSLKLQDMIREHEAEQKRLHVILKSIPDALLIIDVRGVIRLASESAAGFFGNVRMTGSPFMEVVRSYECADLLDSVRKHNAAGSTEFSMTVPEEKHFAVRISPLFYTEQELSGFVAVFHDITQIRKMEEVRKDFVANVSHEIKTPITAIKGFSETLLEGALDDRDTAVKFLHTIRSNSERINSLVDDLMTISRIELGVIRVEKFDVDIRGVFDQVSAVLQKKASGKNLPVRIEIKEGLEIVRADKDRLIQILTNLLDNAVKFTESGTITMGIDRAEGKTFLFVNDTGTGIPAKHLPRMGERFYRVDPARSRKLGGTGLGLAIVKHLVKAHGWEMQIDSAEGKGTSVRITIS